MGSSHTAEETHDGTTGTMLFDIELGQTPSSSSTTVAFDNHGNAAGNDGNKTVPSTTPNQKHKCDGFSSFQEGQNTKQKQEQHEDSNGGDAASNSSSTESGSALSAKSRKIIFALLIILVGACASAGFLSIGILHAKQQQTDQFSRLASGFAVQLEAAFDDYEMFGLWIHESCRPKEKERNTTLGICTRKDFNDLYQYILSVGLDFQSAQFMPYVRQDQREAVEAEAESYYQNNYPHVNYRGVVGLFINDEGVKVEPQDEHDFYWPVHYIEPVVGNEAAVELDLYSSPTQKKTIQNAVSNWVPSVTDRLKLVQETDPSAYSIILHHPGIPLNSSSAHNSSTPVSSSSLSMDKPNSISLLVIRVPALLVRTSLHLDATDSASFYIFDDTYPDQESVFLGAHTAYVHPDGAVTYSGLPEISLADLKASTTTRLELRQLAIADRQWTVAVVAIADTYEPATAIVIVGGVVIFMASLILSTCFWSHMTRVGKVNDIKAQAAQEKADIIVETARKQTLAERQLNEYIAHEVRNPLSSAIAALSFVKAATKEPKQTDEAKKTLQDDLKIVDSSLQFINELLRNMLDMNRAANQQMKIDMAPTDILQDVLEPVASILHLRGNKVEILVECPPNTVILSDRLRLKQVILNLASNSTKFVSKGFIRLKCVVLEESPHGGSQQSVQIHLEDSGPGIPLGKRSNLFQKFQQSLDLLSQGTGIGLCLCKHLANLMNGDLWLDEEYESGIEGFPGTRFVLDLRTPPLDDDYWDENQSLLGYDNAYPIEVSKGPTNRTTGQNDTPGTHTEDSLMPGSNQNEHRELNVLHPPLVEPLVEQSTEDEQQQAARPEKSHHAPELPEALSVLFVDDDVVLRKLFSRSLKRVAPGWEVQEAANGETALHMVGDGEGKFDVIFLDQYMSSIEKQLLGTETARALRAKGITSRICGLSANDAEVPFLEAGADKFLFKPFPCEKDALRRALLDVLFGPSKRGQKSEQ